MDKKSFRELSYSFNINNNIVNIDGEIWKDICGFEGIYQVSNKGRVKNINSNKLMSNFIVGNYYKVSLKSKSYFVHKLVAEAFIPNYYNKEHVDHIDTNNLNNNVENLRWCTTKENNNNPITISKQTDRLKSYNEERKVKVVKSNSKNFDNIEIFESILDAAKSINDASTNISRVCKANDKIKIPRYKCKGYYFIYYSKYENR